MTDMLGGQLDAAFIDVGNVKASLKSDKIRIIAITGEERLKLIPEVRTLTEMGFKDFEPYPFFALYLPAGTPQPIVDKLGKEINSIILNPANRAKIEELGLQPSGQIGQQFKDTVTRDYDTWGNVIKAGKIKLEQ
jgi:tripartite-type tricarboxylate transporter receptor subunit TctC